MKKNDGKQKFDSMNKVLSLMCNKVDAFLQTAKEQKSGKFVWDGFDGYKDFLKHIETCAIEEVSEELGISEASVKMDWKIMTMPLPVYLALENSQLPIAKIKLMTVINFDFDSDSDIAMAQKIIDFIGVESNTIDDIKNLIKQESVHIWNSQCVVMERIALQNKVPLTTKI